MSEPFSEVQKRMTKDLVLLALLRILGTKSFSEITITELTKVAGVSRPAFYRNFRTKEDVILFHLNEIFQKLIIELKRPGYMSKAMRTKTFFTFFSQERTIVSLLSQAELTSLVYDNFCQHVTHFFRHQTDKLSNSPLYEKYLPQYIASGLFRVLVEWIKGGRTESIDEIAAFVGNLTGG